MKPKKKRENHAIRMADRIKEAFGRFKVNVRVEYQEIRGDKTVYSVKLKKNSRLKQLYDFAEDVQRRLELTHFSIVESGQEILLVISEKKKIKYPTLPSILTNDKAMEFLRKMELPCIAGFTPLGVPVCVDLKNAPHVLMGGASNSGKTVGLQALITTIAAAKSVTDVCLVLIDTGADGLLPFENLPHLSCEVIKEKTAASHALAAVVEEMERRKGLEHTDPHRFQSLPRIMVVIDELQALMRGTDKRTTDLLIDSINSLLERGRHTKINLVLAAQNPIQRNVKVDLSNATARIAFSCARKNNADTIIENCGAENLPGNGAMYFSFPGLDTQQLQGINITSTELTNIVSKISYDSLHFFNINAFNAHKCKTRFTIPNDVLQASYNNVGVPRSLDLYAEMLFYTLGQQRISAKELQQFRVDWYYANNFLDDLCSRKIVSAKNGRQPRWVLPHRLEDIPEDLLICMESHGFTRDRVQTCMAQRFRSGEKSRNGEISFTPKFTVKIDAEDVFTENIFEKDVFR